MNLFVAVVMFVMVPLACGADVTWEIASPRDRALWNHPREENKTSNSNVNNDTHEQTGADSTQDRPAPRLRRPNAPPLTNIDNVGSAPSRKDVDKREYINPQEEANIIQRRANIIQWVMAALTFALVVLGCVIGRRQMEIMARQTSYMEAATRYAGDAARAAKESVEIASQSMRVANRAYLTLGWRKRDNRHIVKDAQFAGVCRVVNAGLTPARLIAQHFHCYLGVFAQSAKSEHSTWQR